MVKITPATDQVHYECWFAMITKCESGQKRTLNTVSPTFAHHPPWREHSISLWLEINRQSIQIILNLSGRRKLAQYLPFSWRKGNVFFYVEHKRRGRDSRPEADQPWAGNLLTAEGARFELARPIMT